MPNNIAVSITADVADLQVKRAIMSAELKSATKDLNDFAKQARVAGSSDELRAKMLESADAISRVKAQMGALDQEQKNFQRGQRDGVGVSAQNSAALKNLSFQLNDIATGFASGMPPMMIFAQQSSQVVQAFQMMEGGGGKVASFLGGPWGMAITAATVVVTPFIAKLLDAKSALQENAEQLEAVKAGDSGLGDAQRALGQMFDLTTGKLKEQNDMLRLNARLTAQKLRAEGMADEEQARNLQKQVGHPGLLDFGPRRMTTPALQRLEARRTSGEITNEQAMIEARKLNFSGTGLTAAQYNEMLIKADEGKLKQKTADQIDKTLDTGKLDKALYNTGGKKGGGGPDVTSKWAEELQAQEIASGEFFKDQTANELKFWQGKLALTTAGSKEWLAVQGHIYQASRTLAQQDYQDKIADYNERIQADRNDWTKQQADWQEKLAFIRSKYGEQGAEYKNAFREFERAQQEHNARELASQAAHTARVVEGLRRQTEEAARAREEQAQGSESVLRSGGGGLGGEIEAEKAIARMHAQRILQKIADNETLHASESALMDADIAKAQQMYGNDQLQYQGLLDAKAKADERYRDTKRSLDEQLHAQSIQDILAVQRTYSGYISGMVGSTVSGFSGMLTGQTTWAQASKGIFNSVVGTITQQISQIATKWLVSHLFMSAIQRAELAAQTGQHIAAETVKTSATAAATAAQVGLTSAGAAATGAITVALAEAQIATSAAVGSAGAFASQAAIPIVGPGLGAAAAIAVGAAILGFTSMIAFAQGTNELPGDMIAQVHAGERIVPAADNRELMAALRERRNQTATSGSAASGPAVDLPPSGGESNTNININVSALDGHSAKRVFMDNRGHIAEALRKYTRNGGR